MPDPSQEATAREETEHILAMLSSPEPSVRIQALRRVGHPTNAVTIPINVLASLLKDEIRDVRRSAINAFVRLGEDSVDAIPSLVEALLDQDKWTRKHAGQALRGLGAQVVQAIPPLMDALESQNPSMRCAALNILSRIALQPETVVPKLLVILLTDSDPRVRRVAITAIGAFPSEAHVSVPFLIGALGNRGLRVEAIDALVHIGAEANSAIPRLLELLASPDCGREVLEHGALALGHLGAGDEHCKSLLLRIVEVDQDIFGMRVNFGAVEALLMLDANCKELIRVLLRSLEDAHTRVDIRAIQALKRLAPAAPEIAPVLLRILKENRSDHIRRACASALTRFDSNVKKEMVGILEQDLADVSNTERSLESAKILADLGRNSQLLATRVINSLASTYRGSSNWLTRLRIVRALRDLWPSSQETMELLREATKDADPNIAFDARRQLSRLDTLQIQGLLASESEEHG